MWLGYVLDSEEISFPVWVMVEIFCSSYLPDIILQVQPNIMVQAALSPNVTRPILNLTTPFHLMLSSIVCGVVPPFVSWFKQNFSTASYSSCLSLAVTDCEASLYLSLYIQVQQVFLFAAHCCVVTDRTVCSTTGSSERTDRFIVCLKARWDSLNSTSSISKQRRLKHRLWIRARN